jgi:CheY-like chemotaxis protein
MSEATLKKAIEPFFSTKEIGKGTGLGLSMVHGLAVQHGGLFQLESADQKGTIATLWLPAATAPVVPLAAAAPQAPQQSRSATILVVDDDILIAMATVDMLEDLGHTVVEANSGKQALDILASGRKIDAMMTDHAMPGMTGMELAEAARKIHPDLPILLATGYADLPAGQKSDLPRLTKPYMQDTLRAEIDRLLAGQAA